VTRQVCCWPDCGDIAGPVSIVGSPSLPELGHHHRVHDRVRAFRAGGVRTLRAWLDAGAQFQDVTPFPRVILENE